MSHPLKKVFKTTHKVWEDGKQVDKEVELAVRMPTAQEKQVARRVYARSWREFVEAGAIMREALDRYLRDQKIWDEMRQKSYERLRRQILDGERKLGMGKASGLKSSEEAKTLALQVSDWRDEMAELLTERNRVDSNTADAMADQEQFNFFVAVCTVYNETGKPFFTYNGFDPAVEAYIDQAGEPAGREAASKFAEMWYGAGADDNSLDKLPERKFLRDHGFADEKGRLVDKRGRLVDRQGRLIDENGRFVDEKGEFVDADGNRVDENGKYVVEYVPFDDEETPVRADVEGEKDAAEEGEPQDASLSGAQAALR